MRERRVEFILRFLVWVVGGRRSYGLTEYGRRDGVVGGKEELGMDYLGGGIEVVIGCWRLGFRGEVCSRDIIVGVVRIKRVFNA